MLCTGAPDCSQKPVSASGSDASTQVSLEIAPAWLEMRPSPSSGATRVRPPGITT